MARPRVYDESTRRELIRAAGSLLAERGPDAVSVRAIADAVGATTSAIYRLFGSKAELVRGMYVAGFATLDDHLARVAVTDDPWRDVLELGLAYRASALAEPHLYAVMFERAVPGFTPDADDAALALGTLGHLRQAVTRIEATEGLPEGLTVGTATAALWARVHGLASLELAGGLGDGGEPLWRAVLTADQRGWRVRGQRQLSRGG